MMTSFLPNWRERALHLGLLGLLLLAGYADPLRAEPPVLKVDRVTLSPPGMGSASFTRVDFRRTYASPPLVFVMTRAGNPDPTRIRITNVTTTGFDAEAFEATSANGQHGALDFDYVAILPGQYTLGDGTLMEAGLTSTTAFQSRLLGGSSWDRLTFASTFGATPAVLMEIQGSANATLVPGTNPTPWLTVATNNLDASGADFALDRAEVTTGSIAAAESVAYLAIDRGVSNALTDALGASVRMTSLASSDSITGWGTCQNIAFGTTLTTPIALATKASRDGIDGGWLRRCALSTSTVGLVIDEDTATDTERSHTTEEASVIAFDRAFDGALPAGALEADSATVNAVSPGSANFTQVLFANAFSAPPLIFSLVTEGDLNPATLRLRNVTTNGFQIAAVEPTNSPGAHPSITVDYIAVLPGAHTLEDGTRFEAQSIATSLFQASSGSTGWEAASFLHSYATPPAVVAQIQSLANEPGLDPSTVSVPFLAVAIDNLTAAGASVALERAEATPGSVSVPETIGLFAFQAAIHGQLTDLTDGLIEYDARVHANGYSGFDNGCFSLPYTAPFGAAPLAVAQATTRNGGNGGWARRCGNGASALQAHHDEDQTSDSERSHIAEDVAVVAFEGAFEWSPLIANIVVTATSNALIDGVSVANPKSIPGADVEYRIGVVNTGRGLSDSDSVIVTDAVPADTVFYAGTSGDGSDAVTFSEGSPASTLAFDGSADLFFSSDGGATYTYVPTAGFDPNVTHFQARLRGAFAASTVSGGDPSFELRYRVRLE
ncbi:MAG: hypothetical protein AAF515_22405 [Pseudomonadota bacterium]